jgi:hypothetical protein
MPTCSRAALAASRSNLTCTIEPVGLCAITLSVPTVGPRCKIVLGFINTSDPAIRADSTDAPTSDHITIFLSFNTAADRHQAPPNRLAQSDASVSASLGSRTMPAMWIPPQALPYCAQTPKTMRVERQPNVSVFATASRRRRTPVSDGRHRLPETPIGFPVVLRWTGRRRVGSLPYTQKMSHLRRDR